MEVQPVDYGVMIAMLLAISLAAERIVAIAKNLIPGLAEAEPAAGADVPDGPRDRGRRLLVQAVAFGSCWVAAAFVTPNFNFFGTVSQAGLNLPTPLVAFLAMGGSAFWVQILGISSALKDLKKAQADLVRTAPAVAAAAGAAAAPPSNPLQNLHIANVPAAG